LAIFPSFLPEYYSVVSGGVPYVLDCTADLVGLLTCDSDPETRVYDDSPGSGIVLPGSLDSADKSNVIAGFASYSSAGLVVQFVDLSLGNLSAVAQDPVTSFLGRSSTTGRFDIGLAGYLNSLKAADAELAKSAGSSGGTDISAQIDALLAKLDNGVSCAVPPVPPALPNPVYTVGLIMNDIYAIYRQAPGTKAQPIVGTPGAGAFARSNLVPRTDVPNVIDPLLSLLVPANLAFALNDYKFLFPTGPGLAAFDPTRATPRVDQADATFATRFEQVPQLSPLATQAGDGNITFMEVLCAAD
jgi:hypothetical protein